MARGEFTKQEASKARKALEKMFETIPKSKRTDFIDYLNDASFFISAAEKIAPEDVCVFGWKYCDDCKGLNYLRCDDD